MSLSTSIWTDRARCCYSFVSPLLWLLVLPWTLPSLPPAHRARPSALGVRRAPLRRHPLARPQGVTQQPAASRRVAPVQLGEEPSQSSTSSFVMETRSFEKMRVRYAERIAAHGLEDTRSKSSCRVCHHLGTALCGDALPVASVGDVEARDREVAKYQAQHLHRVRMAEARIGHPVPVDGAPKPPKSQRRAPMEASWQRRARHTEQVGHDTPCAHSRSSPASATGEERADDWLRLTQRWLRFSCCPSFLWVEVGGFAFCEHPP